MPKGVYKHKTGYKQSDEHKKKIKDSNLGQKRSEETKKKLSESHKSPRPYRLGIHLSDETKKKISNTLKKNPVKYWLGKKRYKEDITKCNFWKGGKSYEVYSVDWTNTLKQSIRERDKYTCQLCKEHQGEEALSVHHIDYNKQNCDPNNLISLCRLCHSKTNFKRDYWLDYFNKHL